jgi:CRISPR-associated protein Csx1
MSVDNVLVVAPWGLPPQWRDVMYVLEVDGKCFKGSRRYCTTLIPLLLSMEDRVKAGKVDVVIIALDSLVNKYTKTEDSTCFKCYNELSMYIDEASKSSSYNELTLKLKEFIVEFIKCLFEKYGLSLNINDNLNVIIAPAIGSPGGRWVFRGDLQDFESRVLYELGKLCLTKPYPRVIIDLSHGINFMPSLVIHLIRKLVSIQLLAHKGLGGVTVEVFNSDPIPPLGTPERDIRINRAVYEDVRSILLVHNIPEFIDLSHVVESDESLKSKFLPIKIDLTNKVSSVLRDIRCIYSSLYYPLPLALHYLLHRDVCECIDSLTNVLDRVTDYVVVVDYGDPNSPTIVRPITVNPDTLYIYYIARALCKRIGGHSGEAPTIDYIKSEVMPIYEYVHESLPILIGQELSILEKLSKDLKDLQNYQSLKGTWKTPNEVRLLVKQLAKQPSESREGKTSEGEKSRKRGPDKRILIAHAGFQDEFIQILINDEFKLKYVLDPKRILKEAGLLIK